MDKHLTTIGMRVVTCDCGITWAAPEKWFKAREDDHKTFHCPNGCNRYYPSDNKVERLEKELQYQKSCCISAQEEANQLERRMIAYKGHVTRLKKKTVQE